jgi:hypothetical protein
MILGTAVRCLVFGGPIWVGATLAVSGQASASGLTIEGRLASPRHLYHVAQALNPQSAAYLSLFLLDRIPAVQSVSGRSLALIDRLPVAEYPNYDPIRDIEEVSIRWTQTSGPSADLLQPNTRHARVKMPDVSTPTPLTFQVTVQNASGARTGELKVTVLPAK